MKKMRFLVVVLSGMRVIEVDRMEERRLNFQLNFPPSKDLPT
jgi:hypothetical protein